MSCSQASVGHLIARIVPSYLTVNCSQESYPRSPRPRPISDLPAHGDRAAAVLSCLLMLLGGQDAASQVHERNLHAKRARHHNQATRALRHKTSARTHRVRLQPPCPAPHPTCTAKQGCPAASATRRHSMYLPERRLHRDVVDSVGALLPRNILFHMPAGLEMRQLPAPPDRPSRPDRHGLRSPYRAEAGTKGSTTNLPASSSRFAPSRPPAPFPSFPASAPLTGT